MRRTTIAAKTRRRGFSQSPTCWLILLFAFCVTTPRTFATDYTAGTNPWLKRQIDSSTLVPSIRNAADYLVRNQLPDGQFVYIKDPLGKSFVADRPDKYSLVRHLGAAYALIRAYEVTGTPLYLETARKGLDFITRFVKTKKGWLYVKGIKGKLSLGENGFALIAMTLHDKLSRKPRYKTLNDGLARFIKKYLKYDGKYSTKGEWAECQALIGLVHYYLHQEQQPEIIDVARTWLTEASEDGNISHWSAMALQQFSRIDPDRGRKFVDHAIATGKELLDDVITPEDADHKEARTIGSRKGKLASCSATARNEGIIAIHEFLKTHRKFKSARMYKRRAQEHLAFAMQFQYESPGNFFEKSKRMSRISKLFDMKGGVFNKPEDGFVRIDFVAHHIRAMVAYHTLDNKRKNRRSAPVARRNLGIY